jgi:hypothetical protein
MRRLLSAHVTSCLLLALALIALPGCLVSPARADLMVVGNDQKVVFDAEGKTKVGEVEVGGLPEGVGNYVDSDVSILKVNGTTITDTGKKLKLPGQPASMRGRAR